MALISSEKRLREALENERQYHIAYARMKVEKMVPEVKVNGRWCKVTWYIFRSWTGPRRLDGELYYGPSCLLGHALPNPYVEGVDIG